jgi:hypothetical protein
LRICTNIEGGFWDVSDGKITKYDEGGELGRLSILDLMIAWPENFYHEHFLPDFCREIL